MSPLWPLPAYASEVSIFSPQVNPRPASSVLAGKSSGATGGGRCQEQILRGQDGGAKIRPNRGGEGHYQKRPGSGRNSLWRHGETGSRAYGPSIHRRRRGNGIVDAVRKSSQQ